MRANHTFLCVAACVFAVFVTDARAGGPLVLGGFDGTTPVLYGASRGALTLHLDSDSLTPSLTNEQSDAIIGSAASAWNGIDTSSVSLTLGSDLATPLTAANFLTESERQIVDYGRSHVVYDQTGEIIDLLYGSGAKSTILGLGSSYYRSTGTEFIGGYLILNGWLELSTAAYVATAMHEIGHVMGIDHTQLDGTQGLSSNQYPIMYPLSDVNDPQTAWHEDDESIVSRLYPSSAYLSKYVLIEGHLVSSSGTPVRGANVWVEEETTGKLYSSVSDYLTAGDGYFAMAVPPGTYLVHAEPIQYDFSDGSSVGPYAENSGDVSFQDRISQQMARDESLNAIVLAAGTSCFPRLQFVVDGVSSWICNAAPRISQVAVVPSNPTESDDLEASYDYADTEGDAESGTLLRWYRNGEHDSAFDDESRIVGSATTAGETWQVEVTPSDGAHLGRAMRSAEVVIAKKGGALTLDGEASVSQPRPPASSDEGSGACGCATADGMGYPTGDAFAVLLVMFAIWRRRLRRNA